MRHQTSHPATAPLPALALGAALLTAAVAATAPLPAQAQEPPADFEDGAYYQSYVFGHPEKPSQSWLLAYGGRLYDQWWAVLQQEPPDGTHPSYPAEGGFDGADSWRCVECHGWDYRGHDGSYGEGPHYTGIPGIAGARGAAPEAIVARLRDETHGFTPEMLPPEAATALALFVSLGQVAPGAASDPATGRFDGDAERGRAIFQNVCAICHDYDGGAWIGGEAGVGDSLGAIARGAPALALHKVMNGQTYADMPAMRAFGLPTVVDILSYVQTLERRQE